MSESVKSVTSLILLVGATIFFAAAWNSDARAQQRIAAEMSRSVVRPQPAPASPPRVPHQSSRQRSVTMEVDPSPLARLSPGRYRMVDSAGRTAWLSVAPTYGSGLPPRSRVTLLNVDGLGMALIREENATAGNATAQFAR